MDLADHLSDIAHRAKNQIQHMETEESIKTSLVLPFIQALGYDVFNPLEVVPEFTADFGLKRGEKVDYALKAAGNVVMVMECKKAGMRLETQHAAQLYRYYSVSEAKFGVLTDGLRYLFYTDLDAPNVMDERPFFEFNLLRFDGADVARLKQFSRDIFDSHNIRTDATEMRTLKAVKSELLAELDSPSSEFVRMIASRVQPNQNVTAAIREKFSELIKKVNQQISQEKAQELLSNASNSSNPASWNQAAPLDSGEDVKQTDEGDEADEMDAQVTERSIVTTVEEKEAFRIIQTIASEVTDPENIFMRDSLSYCGILFTDNNRKTIARLRLDKKKKPTISILLNGEETRYPVTRLTDILKVKEQLIQAIKGQMTED
jgi:predicted type IV restriction endonuclease